jgi:hypothetical protein
MIVLPMAGGSTRFARAGYEIPKFMLPLHGHSVFAHALGSFCHYFDAEGFLFVCRDDPGTAAFIGAQATLLGLAPDRMRVIALPRPTAGQAETVAEGLRLAGVAADEALTIFNIDTFRPGFRYADLFDRHAVDGYLEVFTGEGDAWSFVRAADERAPTGRALEVAEKRRISTLCSDGLYHFRTASRFLSLYAETASEDPARLDGGERYVAPLYDLAIRHGLDIRYQLIAAEDIRFCGTPEQYQALCVATPFGPLPAEEGR